MQEKTKMKWTRDEFTAEKTELWNQKYIIVESKT